LLGLVRLFGDEGDDGEGRRRLLWWTMLAFVTHLGFGLFVTNAGGLVQAYLRAPDSYAYHNYAIEIVRHWTTGFPLPDLPAGKEGFYYMLAALYWMFGAHTAAGLAVNATLGAALAPVLSDTTRRLFGPAAADYAVKLVVLLPGLFLWTSQLMKEAPILLLIALTANLAARLLDRLSVVALVTMGLVLGLLFTFRAWVALVLAGGLVAGITFGKEQVVSGLSTAVSALALIALVVSLGIGYSGYQAAVAADLQEAQAVRRDLALSAASGYDAAADISTSTGAITYLPRGLANFALGPFPWQIRQARQLIVLPEVLAWWVLLPSLVRGLRKGWSWRGRRCLILVLPAGAVACLLALAIGNFGTVVRERMQLVVLLVPFVALGLVERAARRSRHVEQDELVAAG
ncbi:MAG: hypothetical protein M3203_01555, partial [Actinomycetota bacterium]|nr:hypothetical protein [Actinomycetota bacterium]